MGYDAGVKLYADRPLRRSLQIAADLALVGWIWLWVTLGNVVHDATLGLARPGRELQDSASGLAGTLRDAGRTIADVPLVPDSIRSPFDASGAAADKIAAAGASQVEAVQSLAFWLGLTSTLVPVLLALLIHLPLRVRFVRRATAGQRFLDSRDDLDLFALRALSHQPLHVLARVSEDPAGAWRRGEQDVVARLAELELRDVGLRPPRRLLEQA